MDLTVCIICRITFTTHQKLVGHARSYHMRGASDEEVESVIASKRRVAVNKMKAHIAKQQVKTIKTLRSTGRVSQRMEKKVKKKKAKNVVRVKRSPNKLKPKCQKEERAKAASKATAKEVPLKEPEVSSAPNVFQKRPKKKKCADCGAKKSSRWWETESGDDRCNECRREVITAKCRATRRRKKEWKELAAAGAAAPSLTAGAEGGSFFLSAVVAALPTRSGGHDARIPTSPSPDDADSSARNSAPDNWEDAAGSSDTSPDGDVLLLDEEQLVARAERNPKPVEVNKSKKEHVNVVFIGDIDAGKSSIGGQIMNLTGMVDKRTVEKYEREAKEKHREALYLSWALDSNPEEREKGKFVGVGMTSFETGKKHYSILDAPCCKSFIPNIIGGAAPGRKYFATNMKDGAPQADLAVLVISARKGEFETGFKEGGQTREHAMLVKTDGVKRLIVLINKMDDPTVEWSEERFNECREKLLLYLQKLGFDLKDLTFMPCSGLTGAGLKEVDKGLCPWYSGPSFIPFIDSLPPLSRPSSAPFLMPIGNKYRDMGTVVMGKVEAGETRRGQTLVMMPNRTTVTVDQLWIDDEQVGAVGAGESVKIKLKGVEEEEVQSGFILCEANGLCKVGTVFDAQVTILEHKSNIGPGFGAVMQIHCAKVQVVVKELLCLMDKKTGEKSKRSPRYLQQEQVAIVRLECASVVCMEPFKLFPGLGTFTLKDKGKTIAIGEVLNVIE